MKATINLGRPIKSVEIKPPFVWGAILFIITLCANVAAGSWIAATTKVSYDNRLENVESAVKDMSRDIREIRNYLLEKNK